jgi:hypothetical protein
MGGFVSAADVVATKRFTQGAIDETAYGAFVARQVKSTKRQRDKGRRDFAGLTDAECVEMAESYCRMYRHQFRVLVPVA